MERLTRWWPAGFGPYNSKSMMCDNQVTGCQLAKCPVVKAHFTLSRVNPDCTLQFFVTYSASS